MSPKLASLLGPYAAVTAYSQEASELARDWTRAEIVLSVVMLAFALLIIGSRRC